MSHGIAQIPRYYSALEIHQVSVTNDILIICGCVIYVIAGCSTNVSVLLCVTVYKTGVIARLHTPN